MELNINELAKTKTFQTNIFNGSKIISYDLGMNVVVITKLSEKVSETKFAIDNKGFDIIKKFKTPELTFDEESKILEVKQGKSKFKIKTFDQDVPQFDLSDLQTTKVNTKALKRAYKFTSITETRPILTSVCVKGNGNILATDSYVLYRFLKDPNDTDENCSEINITKDFINVIDSEDEEIEFSFNNSCVIYKKENVTYLGRLVAGNFPKLNRVFELRQPNELIYDFDELKEAINFSSNVGKTKETNGIIYCRLKDNYLKTYGESKYECQLTSTVPENLDISFTIDKLLLLLDCYEKENDKFVLMYNDSRSPVSFAQKNEKIVVAPVAGVYDD